MLDVHLHLRQDPESNFAHITGSGVTKAVLLTRVQAVERARGLAEKYPGRFVWFVSADVTKPENQALLKKAVKDGALGLGEIKDPGAVRRARDEADVCARCGSERSHSDPFRGRTPGRGERRL